MGALMGAGVGLTIGFIFGSYSIIRCEGDVAFVFERLTCWLPCVEEELVLAVSSPPFLNTC